MAIRIAALGSTSNSSKMSISWTTLTHPSMAKVNLKLLEVEGYTSQYLASSKKMCDRLVKKINHRLDEYQQLSHLYQDLITPLTDLRYNVKDMHACVDREMNYMTECFETRKEEIPFLEWKEHKMSAGFDAMYTIEANLEELDHSCRMFARLKGILQDDAEEHTEQNGARLQFMVKELEVERHTYQTFLDSGLTPLKTLLEAIDGDLTSSENEDESEAEEHRDILADIEEESEKRRIRKRLRRGGEPEAKWLRKCMRNEVYQDLLDNDESPNEDVKDDDDNCNQ